MNIARAVVVLTLGVFLCSAPAWTAVTGRIAGTVTDKGGNVIAGAKITMTSTAQGVKYRSASDSKGKFAYLSVPVGRYELQVEAPGFKTQTRAGLVVDVDAILKIDLTMEAAEKTGPTAGAQAYIQVASAGLRRW